VNHLVLSGTVPHVLSGTGSSCYRGPKSLEIDCRSKACLASNLSNLDSFGIYLMNSAFARIGDKRAPLPKSASRSSHSAIRKAESARQPYRCVSSTNGPARDCGSLSSSPTGKTKSRIVGSTGLRNARERADRDPSTSSVSPATRSFVKRLRSLARSISSSSTTAACARPRVAVLADGRRDAAPVARKSFQIASSWVR
jgi:hypothetical protein